MQVHYLVILPKHANHINYTLKILVNQRNRKLSLKQSDFGVFQLLYSYIFNSIFVVEVVALNHQSNFSKSN